MHKVIFRRRGESKTRERRFKLRVVRFKRDVKGNFTQCGTQIEQNTKKMVEPGPIQHFKDIWIKKRYLNRKGLEKYGPKMAKYDQHRCALGRHG